MWEPRQGPPCEEAKARCMFFLYTSYSCMVTLITPGINWTPTVACSSSLSSVAQEPPTCSCCLWGGQRVSCHGVARAHVLVAVDHQLQGNMWKSHISCWGQTSYHPAMGKVRGRIATFDGFSTTAIKKKTFFSSVSLMLVLTVSLVILQGHSYYLKKHKAKVCSSWQWGGTPALQVSLLISGVIQWEDTHVCKGEQPGLSWSAFVGHEVQHSTAEHE